MRPSCVFTGRPADEMHHLSGNGVGGYFDRQLVVPLTRYQHVLEHVALRQAGLGEHSQLDANLLRLRRLAHFFVRLGDHHISSSGLVVMPAETLWQLGLALHAIAEAL
jgi:hypothetical protein